MKFRVFEIATENWVDPQSPLYGNSMLPTIENIKTFFAGATKGLACEHFSPSKQGVRLKRLKRASVGAASDIARSKRDIANINRGQPAKTKADKARLKARLRQAQNRLKLAEKKQRDTLRDIEVLSSPGYQELTEPDPTNPIILDYREYPNGYALRLTPMRSDTGEIGKRLQSLIVTQLMELVDERLAAFGFALTDDNFKLVTAPNRAPVLRWLVRASLFDLEIIGYNNNNRDAINALRLRTGPNSSKDWDSSAGFQFRFFFRFEDANGWALWIPKSMSEVFVDSTDLDKYWAYESNTFFLREKPGVSVIPCYYWDSNVLKVVTPLGETMRSGAGGGAMRSDKVEEADYLWSGNRALGYALGLDLTFYRLFNGVPSDMLVPDGFQRGRTPLAPPNPKTAVSGNMNSEIVYFKRFKDPLPAGKKNAPLETLPLAPERFSKKDDATLGLYVKKQKGDWEFGGGVFGKTGNLLKHKSADRDSAGEVMREAFQNMNFTVNGTDLGSATQFAAHVVNSDTVLRKYWTDASKTVNLRTGANGDLAQLTCSVRTDQEWCHLFGHGDGGLEQFGNFVSGSKHCNTEQLAIECGQRAQKYNGLWAKITGYLMPSQGFVKQVASPEDVAYLSAFDQQAINAKNFVQVMSNYVKAYEANKLGRNALRDLLASGGQSGTRKVVTREAYLNMSDQQQQKTHKAIYEEFRHILRLYYPLAIYVRYKIDDDGTKIFDHAFEAQSESFDLNEFKILSHTVKRVIAISKGDTSDFQKTINMKVESRLETEVKPADVRKWIGRTYRVPVST